MAKRGEKTSATVSVMEANRGKSYDQIGRLIAEALSAGNGTGRLYYRYMVETGKVTGFDAPWLDETAKVKAPKAPKVAKPKTVKMASLVKKASKAYVEKRMSVTFDEIAAIKAKNLETMKAVSARLRPSKKVRDFTLEVEADEPDGDYNPHLVDEEIKSVLEDERLIGVCSKFVEE